MADVVTNKPPQQPMAGKKEVRTIRCRRGHLNTSTNNNDAVFLTEPKRPREPSIVNMSTPSPPPPEDDLDLEKERKKLDMDDIKRRLYQRECERLGVSPVGAVLRKPTTTMLAVKYYNLGAEGVSALSVPLMLDSTLTHLDLEGNAIGDQGVANMYEMLLENCSLTHLNLRQNQLRSRAASLLSKVLCNNRMIVSLNVSANRFEDKDGVQFAEMLKENRTLKQLDLSENNFGHQSGIELGDALAQTETLEEVNLSFNKFRQAGMVKLLEGISENISLHGLNLSYNSCGSGPRDMPAQCLADLLTNCETIHHLDLSNNRMIDLDIAHVAKGLKENEWLETLKIGNNPVNVRARATSAIMRTILANETIPIKLLDMSDLPIAWSDVEDVEALEARGVHVIHGFVHQKETDFYTEPRPDRPRPAVESGEQTSVEDEFFYSKLDAVVQDVMEQREVTAQENYEHADVENADVPQALESSVPAPETKESQDVQTTNEDTKKNGDNAAGADNDNDKSVNGAGSPSQEDNDEDDDNEDDAETPEISVPATPESTDTVEEDKKATYRAVW